MSAGLAAWAVESILASALLMLVVLALRGPVRRAVGPEAAYALWALPAIRLVLPPQSGGAGLTRLVAPVTRRLVDAPGMVVGVMRPDVVPASLDKAALPQIDLSYAGHHAAAVLVPPTAAAGAPSPMLLLLAVWAIGAAGLLAYHVAAHHRFCRRLLANARAAGAANGVAVIETDAATGPLAFGIWRRYVAFPRDFAARYDAAERDLALAHELGHHARGDLIANAAALVVLAVHWFNPLAWRAFRAFRADQEMANDARVLAGCDPASRHAYACAILKTATGATLSPACHLHGIAEIKGRLRMIATTRVSRVRRLGGTAAIAALTLAGLGLTASGTAAAERLKARVSKATGVALPAVPHVPALPSLIAAPAATAAPAAAPQAAPSPEPLAPSVDTAADVPPAPPVPPIPPVPVEAPVPPVPPVPPVAPVAPDRVAGRAGEQVITLPDGRQMRIPATPQVSSARCPGPDSATPAVLHQDGTPKRITICTNRIAFMSREAERRAADAQHRAADAERRAAEASADRAARAIDRNRIERDAYTSALQGLHTARDHMLANRTIGESERREALSAIDGSIAEIEGDLARVR